MSSELPVLPDGWQYVPLNACSAKNSISYGIVQPGAPVYNGVPIIRVNNFRGTQLDLTEVMRVAPEIEAKYSRTRLKGGEILLSIVGTVGQVAVAPKNISGFNVARAVAVIDALPHIGPEWIALCLRSPLSQYLLGSRANTTVQTTINLKDLRALPIPIPPKTERRTITSFITVLDDRITLLRETNKTLEAIAQAIFKSWFVDFDPVRAKMEGRQPEGMDEETAALFPDSFEESEYGAIPQGWSIQPLSIAYEINPSRRLSKGTVSTYLEMANVPTDGLSVAATTRRPFGSGTKFVNGDTLLARITPCLENGKTAFVDFLEDDEVGWGSTEFVVLRPKSPLPPLHAYLLCRTQSFRDHAIQSMSGTSGRQRVQNDVLGHYMVPIPSEEIARKFSGICASLHKKIAANHSIASTLATLRDTLLPRLISGQLRLPEAEALVEEINP